MIALPHLLYLLHLRSSRALLHLRAIFFLLTNRLRSKSDLVVIY